MSSGTVRAFGWRHAAVGCAGLVLAADAGVRSCLVINQTAHASYNNLQAAVTAAAPGAALRVEGTCTGTTVVSQNLVIAGYWGRGPATLNGGGLGTVLTVDAGATVTVKGLTITGGQTTGNGGGIETDGTLTLDNTTVTRNTAVLGGGIDNEGTLTLDNSAVTRNQSASDGGGIHNDLGGTMTLASWDSVSGNTAGTAVTAGGGGIFNAGTMTIGGWASVSGNAVGNSGGGGIDNNRGGELTLDGRASVTGNNAAGGGGIENDSVVTIEGSASVSRNTAQQGGGIFNVGVTDLSGDASVSRNTAEQGGGIFNFDTTSTVTLAGGATVSYNTATGGAGSGGGINNAGGGTLTGAVAGHGGNVFGNKPDDID